MRVRSFPNPKPNNKPKIICDIIYIMYDHYQN